MEMIKFQKKTCGSYEFFEQTHLNDESDERIGECRRYPPTLHGEFLDPDNSDEPYSITDMLSDMSCHQGIHDHLVGWPSVDELIEKYLERIKKFL